MTTHKIKNIRCILAKKEEKIQELTEKTVSFLNELSLIDVDLFGNWYEKGNSKKEALKKKVIFTNDFFYNLISKAWDKKFPELGARFSFWSGNLKEEEISVISFSIGKTIKNPNISNVIYIDFPSSESIKIDDLKIQEIEKLFKTIWHAKEVKIT